MGVVWGLIIMSSSAEIPLLSKSWKAGDVSGLIMNDPVQLYNQTIVYLVAEALFGPCEWVW